jgi:hypothetical protein
MKIAVAGALLLFITSCRTIRLTAPAEGCNSLRRPSARVKRVYSVVLASLRIDRNVRLSNVVWPAEAIGWCGPNDPMLDHDDPWFGGCLQSLPSTAGVQASSTSALSAPAGSAVRLSEVVFETSQTALLKVEITTRDGRVQRAELRVGERDGSATIAPVCTPDPTWSRPIEEG